MTSVMSHDPAVKQRGGREPSASARTRLPIASNRGPARWPPSRAPSRTRSGRPASPRTGARSASSSITSPACTRWRSSWRRRSPPASRSTGVTWDDVHEMNAGHARENDAVTKEAALDLLRRNSTAAAAAIRALSDEELDRAAPVSLNADAPLTCQFMLEDHAVRHSYHHLAASASGAEAVAWRCLRPTCLRRDARRSGRRRRDRPVACHRKSA